MKKKRKEKKTNQTNLPYAGGRNPANNTPCTNAYPTHHLTAHLTTFLLLPSLPSCFSSSSWAYSIVCASHQYHTT